MLTYLKDHIIEEVTGALDYMAKAVEHKGTHCGEVFYQMATMELEHANALTKMFNKEDKPATMTDVEYGTAQKAVLDTYVSGMGKLENMKKLYWTM